MDTTNKSTETVKNQSTESNPKPEEYYFKFGIDAKVSDGNPNAIATHVSADMSCDEVFAINVLLGVMDEHPEVKRIILKAAGAYASKGIKKFISLMSDDLKQTIEEIEKEINDKKNQEPAEPNV